MKKQMIGLMVAGLLCATASADTLSGTKRLLCTTEELKDCVAGTECFNGLPAEYGAPVSLRIDFAGKQVLGESRKSKIRDIEKTDTQLLLQGREMGYGWTIGIDRRSGDMTLSLVNREGAFVLFGRCTAL